MVLVALCLTLVLGVVVAGYVAVCARTMEMSNRSFCTTSSVQLAEIGLEEALWSLNNSSWSEWHTSGNPPAGTAIKSEDYSNALHFTTNQGIPGSVSITVDNYNTTDPFNTPPTIIATATLTMPGRNPEIQKQLQIKVKPAALFSNAVGSVDPTCNPSSVYFTTASGGIVDSYDSALSINPSDQIQNDNHKTDQAIISGPYISTDNANIHGYAASANSVSYLPNSPSVGPSHISTNANQYVFDFVASLPGSYAGNIDSLNLHDGSAVIGTPNGPLKRYDATALSLADNDVLKIQGPVIIDVTGNLTIQGSARIVVSKGHNPDLDGSAQIYVAGNLNIGGGGGGGGSVYVTDSTNDTIRKITPEGSPPPPAWVVTTSAGTVGSAGSTDGTGTAARFNSPGGMAVDDVGNVYVADTNNHTIRKITPAGGVTTLAGSGVQGSANGTCSAAMFSSPKSVAVDNAENDNTGSDNKRIIYVADTNNHTIRKITPADGVVATLAGLAGVQGSADGTGSARFYSPGGVAVDGTGNVYVADTNNHTIRKITPADGVVATLAGLAGIQGNADGTGSAAQFNSPGGVAVDDAGNVYVADTSNDTIRKISPTGAVTTLAGSAGSAGSADGTGSAAQFNSPSGVAVDDAGNVYVADTNNYTIRKITPAGVVTTLVGTAGSLGSADGTGGAARFYNPTGLAVDCWGINNLTRRPRKLAIFCNSNSSSPGQVITTTNDLYGFYCAVYAPNSPLVVNGDPRIYGALVGQSVTFNGTPTIHYDLDLRKASFSVVNTPYDVSQWLVSN